MGKSLSKKKVEIKQINPKDTNTKNIKSNYILKKIFNNLIINKLLNIVKYNKNIKKE